MQNKLGEDDYAIILLCTPIAAPRQSQVKPMTRVLWNKLYPRITASNFRTPGGLLNASAEELAKAFPEAPQVSALLNERGKLAIILESLANKGIRAVTILNDEYPARLKKLGDKAPPVFFFSGDLSLLNLDGIAFVGSRDADENALEFTTALARRCAREGLSVVSGAARGVDQAAMNAALDNGGTAVGFVADSLEAVIRKPEWRKAIEKKKLVLLSATSPYYHFSVGQAMDRNKYIYAQSQCAVVVESTSGKGGTWAGAVENLSNKWVPLYVRASTKSDSGNNALVERGGIRLSDDELLKSIRDIFNLPPQKEITVEPTIQEGPAKSLPDLAYTPSKVTITIEVKIEQRAKAEQLGENLDLYEAAKRRLYVSLLKGSRSSKELSQTIGVNTTQLNVWLKKAMDERLIIKRESPAQYMLITRTLSSYQPGFTPANMIHKSEIHDLGNEPMDIYSEVKKRLPVILKDGPKLAEEISKKLGMDSPTQVEIWLTKACSEGYLEQLKKPKRYRLKVA